MGRKTGIFGTRAEDKTHFLRGSGAQATCPGFLGFEPYAFRTPFGVLYEKIRLGFLRDAVARRTGRSGPPLYHRRGYFRAPAVGGSGYDLLGQGRAERSVRDP